MSTPRYHINLFWSNEDACWIADAPDLRFCTTHGDTPVQALTNMEDAMQGWLEVVLGRGQPLPEAKYRPAIYAAKFAA